MSRVAKRIGVDELHRRIDTACRPGGEFDWSGLFDLIRPDLKVEFDFENHEFVGYRQRPDGFAYAEFWAGGDWQHPVWFIVYWDGRRLRAYVPTGGNPFNTDTMEAYGNGGREDSDLRNARKRWPDVFAGRDEAGPDDFDFNHDEMRRDIDERIKLRD